MKNKERYFDLIEERPECFMQSDSLKIILDKNAIEEFEKTSEREIGVIYESPYSILLVDLVENSQGMKFTYERIIPAIKDKAVVIVTIFQGKYVLLNQYRHSLRGYQYSFPRGYGEEGLSGEMNAKKEIKEEIGANIISIKQIGTIIADSGLSGNRVDVFVCDVENIQLKKGYEGIKEYQLFDKKELDCMISRGIIDDGYTLAALTLFDKRILSYSDE